MTPIEKACEYLIRKSYPAYDKTTCNKCASKVADAWDFAFDKKVKRFLSAKDCAPTYLDLGFKEVFSYPEQKKEDYKPVIGDVCIIQPVKKKKGGVEVVSHRHGHICVYTQKGWISDFKQGNGGSKLYLADMYGGPIRNDDPSFKIYRLNS